MSFSDIKENNFFINIRNNTLLKFKKITRKVSLLKICFLFLLFFEVFLSLFFISRFPASLRIAIVLGSVIITIFIFFVLLFYFQAKIPYQIVDLKNRFIFSCRKAVSTPKGSTEHHLSIAKCLFALSFYLTDLEYCYFSSNTNSFLSWLGSFFHKEDIFKMREDLLFLSIYEHLKNVKNNPLDVELHVSLAKAYILLANLYEESMKNFSRRKKEVFMKKVKTAKKHAIEEFIILQSFCPNDPWIASQIAKSYHDMKMYEEEKKAYENLLELCPDDNEVMFSLGKIYFRLGENAKGLKVYEELKGVGFEKAKDLLNFYSSAQSIDDIKMYDQYS